MATGARGGQPARLSGQQGQQERQVVGGAVAVVHAAILVGHEFEPDPARVDWQDAPSAVGLSLTVTGSTEDGGLAFAHFADCSCRVPGPLELRGLVPDPLRLYLIAPGCKIAIVDAVTPATGKQDVAVALPRRPCADGLDEASWARWGPRGGGLVCGPDQGCGCSRWPPRR